MTIFKQEEVFTFFLTLNDRVIDVGSEWRSFSNGDNGKEAERSFLLSLQVDHEFIQLFKCVELSKAFLRSRVGAAENTLLGTSDLTTIIGPSTGRSDYYLGSYFHHHTEMQSSSV